MIIDETDCRKCGHKNVCKKSTDYGAYIFSLKQTEHDIPEGVHVKNLTTILMTSFALLVLEKTGRR